MNHQQRCRFQQNREKKMTPFLSILTEINRMTNEVIITEWMGVFWTILSLTSLTWTNQFLGDLRLSEETAKMCPFVSVGSRRKLQLCSLLCCQSHYTFAQNLPRRLFTTFLPRFLFFDGIVWTENVTIHIIMVDKITNFVPFLWPSSVSHRCCFRISPTLRSPTVFNKWRPSNNKR